MVVLRITSWTYRFSQWNGKCSIFFSIGPLIVSLPVAFFQKYWIVWGSSVGKFLTETGPPCSFLL